METNQNKIRASGQESFEKGLKIKDNPYPVGSIENELWSEGWKTAQFLYHKKNNKLDFLNE